MAEELQCPNGHRWSPAGNAAKTCPVCGSAPSTAGDTGAAPTNELPPPPMVGSETRLQTGSSSHGMTPPPGEPAAARNDAAMPETGTLPPEFGRYEVLRVLGKGGMGAVYLARDTELDRRVALKVPHVSHAANPASAERFLREARSAATLDHPNICSVYDVGEIDGVRYISMAYVEGQTLAALIRGNSDPLPQVGVADLIRQLALALAEAHEHGVIHRDLKPANVMVNKRLEPVIMDFGLARRDGAADSRLTAEGVIMGTPAYMSPEQVAGDNEKIGPSTDQFSLGVIMYEMLTGQLPFTGSTGEVLSQIATRSPAPPAELQPGVDGKLSAICMRALSKKPEDRFNGMKEFASALSGWLGESDRRQGVTDAPTLQVGPQTARQDSAEETSSLQLAAQLLANLAARIETGDLSPSEIEIRRRRRRPWWVWALAATALVALVAVVLTLVFRSDNDEKQSVPVTINIEQYTQYVNAVFILDGKEVPREKLAGQVNLPIGRHELVVKYEGKTIASKVFEVEPRGGTKSIAPEPRGKLPPPPKGHVGPKLPNVKVAGNFTLWSRRYYTDRTNPLVSRIAINDKELAAIESRTKRTLDELLQPGWNTLTIATSPQEPINRGNSLSFIVGPVNETKSGERMQPIIWNFYNGEDWTLKNGKYTHKLGPGVKEVPLRFRVLYAGLARERNKLQEGDFVLQSSGYFRDRNPSVTATVFVNGTPITTFSSTPRQVVITDLLKEGDNEIRLVTHRVENSLKDNDIEIKLLGPAEYNTNEGRHFLRPVLSLSAMTGWERNKTTGQLFAVNDLKSGTIDRTVSLYLPQPVNVVGRLPRKESVWTIQAKRYLTSRECPLHTDVLINGKRVARFSSDSRESIASALKPNAWNLLTLHTRALRPAPAGSNNLSFDFGLLGLDEKGRPRLAPVVWSLQNNDGWERRDGSLFHRIGKDATDVTLKFPLYLGDLKHVQLEPAEGDYVIVGETYLSSYVPSVTATVYVNDTPLTTFCGGKRQVVLRPPLIKKGVNKIRLVAKRVDNSFRDNNVNFTVGGPLKYSPAKKRLVYSTVTKFSAMQGWKRDPDTGQLVNTADPKSNTIEREFEFEVK